MIQDFPEESQLQERGGPNLSFGGRVPGVSLDPLLFKAKLRGSQYPVAQCSLFKFFLRLLDQ